MSVELVDEKPQLFVASTQQLCDLHRRNTCAFTLSWIPGNLLGINLRTHIKPHDHLLDMPLPLLCKCREDTCYHPAHSAIMTKRKVLCLHGAQLSSEVGSVNSRETANWKYQLNIIIAMLDFQVTAWYGASCRCSAVQLEFLQKYITHRTISA
jgi:hypothetical protein